MSRLFLKQIYGFLFAYLSIFLSFFICIFCLRVVINILGFMCFLLIRLFFSSSSFYSISGVINSLVFSCVFSNIIWILALLCSLIFRFWLRMCPGVSMYMSSFAFSFHSVCFYSYLRSCSSRLDLFTHVQLFLFPFFLCVLAHHMRPIPIHSF